MSISDSAAKGQDGTRPCRDRREGRDGDRVRVLPNRHDHTCGATMSAGLRGTGMVADDLYLMAHNEASGRPFLQPRALGIGLAGGLLAELMLAGGITLGHDGTLFTGSRPAGPGLTGPGPAGPGLTGPAVPADGLARQVLGLLTAE